MRTFNIGLSLRKNGRKIGSMAHLDKKVGESLKGIVRLSALEVKERFFELLDKLISGELQKIEVELEGRLVAEIVPITK